MRIDQEERMTIACLARKGQSKREIARVLGMSEGSVRYHLRRQAAGVPDGRSLQPQKAESMREAIAYYLAGKESPENVAVLHDWLVAEFGYTGSLRSVQRYCQKHFPQPKRRARRRVETPPGAQSQTDWGEWPQIRMAGREVYGYQLNMRLSHSRFGARVWMPRKDQLSWHTAHNEAFRRLEGIAATNRVDNEKTAMARGGGPWGEVNESYRRYARQVGFHIDPCLVRSPAHKGKVERGIRTGRRWREVIERRWSSWEELQAWTDARILEEAERRTCPATGTTVLEAWEAEKPYLAPVPLLPEPFDVAVTRKVARDCLVAFEGRRYSVPFAWMDQRVEVHGCARAVQVVAGGRVVAEHPRRSRERILIDPGHYEGEATDTVLPPLPLGRMGR